jgi:hypothetical protein
MPRIKIIRANEDQELPVSNGRQSAVIRIDGKFHDIHEDLLPVLADSNVAFELEEENDEPARAGTEASGGAVGLGGLSAPSPLHAAADRMEALAAA